MKILIDPPRVRGMIADLRVAADDYRGSSNWLRQDPVLHMPHDLSRQMGSVADAQAGRIRNMATSLDRVADDLERRLRYLEGDQDRPVRLPVPAIAGRSIFSMHPIVKLANELIEKLKAEFKDLVSYGRFCGPGHTKGAAPVDDMDGCCKKHDDAYRRANIKTGNPKEAWGDDKHYMWTNRGLVDSVKADKALVSCVKKSGCGQWHGERRADCRTYKKRLVALFSARVTVGELIADHKWVFPGV